MVFANPTSSWIASNALELVYRADVSVTASASASATPDSGSRPPRDKIIGIVLAISSGLFIGSSFVLKKRGLLDANEKYHEEAGEGYGYLKNVFWWSGMTLMVIGEICNFVAYAFTDAVIVAPMGALSVVICAILSAVFLKERLSIVGKIACFICIVGSIIIPLNAPSHAAVKDIQEMQHYVIAPGFLSFAGVIILASLFLALWVGPRYGKKSMFVYITICSIIGGLSVVATQGLGSAIIAQIRGEQQFNQWFLYVLLVFVVCTLVTEIIYLNKALNIFNAAMVTPTYYVLFTSATIISSAVLFQGFGGTPVEIVTIVLGFLTICSGVVLLQISNSAKDVPDAAVFSGDLDQMRTIVEQEQPESEPKADTFRGTAGLIRAISKSRRRMEHEEAKRINEDKRLDQLGSIGENEVIEWDGIRRRRTVLGSGRRHIVARQNTVHPPLGMSRFPDGDEEEAARPHSSSAGGAFGFGFRRKSRHIPGNTHGPSGDTAAGEQAVSLEQAAGQPEGSVQMQHIYGLPPELKPLGQHDGSNEEQRKPLHWASEVEDSPTHPSSSGHSLLALSSPMVGRRTFSFQNVFHKGRETTSRDSPASRQSSRSFATPKIRDATEEERLGLVKGDSHLHIPEHRNVSDDSETEETAPDLSYAHPARSGRPDASGRTEDLLYRQTAYAGRPQGVDPQRRHPLPLTPEIDENDEQDYYEAQRHHTTPYQRGADHDARGSFI